MKKGFPTEAEFTAWWNNECSEGRGDFESGGQARKKLCPVARYLHSHGYPEASVGGMGHWWPEGGDDHPLPMWAIKFIEYADEAM